MKERCMNSNLDAEAVTPGKDRGQRILVADDDEALRYLIFRVLVSEGYQVSMSFDGENAWDKLRTKDFDLLLTDSDMPRLKGPDLIKRMRDHGIKMPVILTSGAFSHEATRTFQKDKQLAIAQVVTKPLNIWDFVKIVRNVLGKAAQEVEAEPSRPEPRFAVVDASQPRRSHVLIADDDALVRGSLAAVLESEGYQVDEACDGNEAVDRAIRNKPDLVLLDLNMPHADGWTAFNQLDKITPLLPVIIITARPNQYKEAVRVGVDAFMEKPMNIPILMLAIKRLTSEEDERHVKRVTHRGFVTQLLDENYS